MAQTSSAPPSPAPRDIGAGALFRSPSGDILVVRGSCLLESSGATMLIYQELEAPHTTYTRPLADFQTPASEAVRPPRPLVPAASANALASAWRAHFKQDEGLEAVLAGYDDAWRRLHTRRYVYRLFEIANAQQPLSKPEVLALLLCRLASVSEVPEPGSIERICRQAKSQLLGARDVNWSEVQAHLLAPSQSRLADLLASPLAVDSAEFEVNEELLWLESLQGLQPPPSRKIHDSARLRMLLERAGAGPLFSKEQPDWEHRARTNIETLRLAWLKSWS